MWSDITSILKDSTTKCIIIEGGEPKYVVLTFDEYQQLQKNGEHSIVISPKAEGQADTAERANHELQEIWELGEEDREPNEKVTAISIEDLPF